MGLGLELVVKVDGKRQDAAHAHGGLVVVGEPEVRAHQQPLKVGIHHAEQLVMREERLPQQVVVLVVVRHDVETQPHVYGVSCALT